MEINSNEYLSYLKKYYPETLNGTVSLYFGSYKPTEVKPFEPTEVEPFEPNQPKEFSTPDLNFQENMEDMDFLHEDNDLPNFDESPLENDEGSFKVEKPTYKATLQTKYKLTSDFGKRPSPKVGATTFHKGMDFATPIGTELKSPVDGVVIASKRSGKSGNYVIVQDAQGHKYSISHCSDLLVKAGDKVTNGMVIAKSGNTGVSTGPHVHIAVKKGGEFVRPDNEIINSIL